MNERKITLVISARNNLSGRFTEMSQMVRSEALAEMADGFVSWANVLTDEMLNDFTGGDGMTWVTVRQITSKATDTGAFMNVNEDDLHVSVAMQVWKCPTYLLQDGIHVKLIQFDYQEMADEWLEEHKKDDWVITRLVEIPKIKE